jgi:hypothetical protein
LTERELTIDEDLFSRLNVAKGNYLKKQIAWRDTIEGTGIVS